MILLADAAELKLFITSYPNISCLNFIYIYIVDILLFAQVTSLSRKRIVVLLIKDNNH